MAFSHTGYGIVEPNHLSAQRNGKIYAQLPCSSDIEVLQNGMFLKYDPAYQEDGATDLGRATTAATATGEWLLVFNEIKLYDERKQRLGDFAMKADESVDGKIYPRLFKTDIGDIYTTNMVANGDYTTNSKLTPGTDGILRAVKTTGEDKDPDGVMTWKVVKVTTLPDGKTPGLKLQRIQ